jgi:hypothetical protein
MGNKTAEHQSRPQRPRGHRYAGRRAMPGLTPGSDLPSRPEGAGSPWPAKPGC